MLHATVAEAKERVDSAEFVAWQAYERLEGPFGPSRQDYGAALVAMTVSNRLRGRHEQAHGLDDFLLRFGPQEPTQDELRARLDSFFASMGGHRV